VPPSTDHHQQPDRIASGVYNLVGLDIRTEIKHNGHPIVWDSVAAAGTPETLGNFSAAWLSNIWSIQPCCALASSFFSVLFCWLGPTP